MFPSSTGPLGYISIVSEAASDWISILACVWWVGAGGGRVSDPFLPEVIHLSIVSMDKKNNLIKYICREKFLVISPQKEFLHRQFQKYLISRAKLTERNHRDATEDYFLHSANKLTTLDASLLRDNIQI